MFLHKTLLSFYIIIIVHRDINFTVAFLTKLSRRLHRRNTDEEAVIQRRLEKARQECRECVHYDYLVVNDTVMNAAQEIQSILQAEQCRTQKRIGLAQGIIGPQAN